MLLGRPLVLTNHSVSIPEGKGAFAGTSGIRDTKDFAERSGALC